MSTIRVAAQRHPRRTDLEIVRVDASQGVELLSAASGPQPPERAGGGATLRDGRQAEAGGPGWRLGPSSRSMVTRRRRRRDADLWRAIGQQKSSSPADRARESMRPPEGHGGDRDSSGFAQAARMCLRAERTHAPADGTFTQLDGASSLERHRGNLRHGTRAGTAPGFCRRTVVAQPGHRARPGPPADAASRTPPAGSARPPRLPRCDGSHPRPHLEHLEPAGPLGRAAPDDPARHRRPRSGHHRPAGGHLQRGALPGRRHRPALQ